MLTAVLYVATAAGALWLVSRTLVRVSWQARLALMLLPLCFTGRALTTGQVYAPIELPFDNEPLLSFRATQPVPPPHNGMLSDVYCLNMPWRYAVRVAYSHGEWALWNPAIFAGDILAAAAQPTPYEPVFLLSLLLPASTSLTFLAAMTLFLAALLMFAFLRELGCREPAALVGAAGWTFCTFMVFWLEWVIAPSTMWFPLVLLGVRRVVRQRTLGAAAVLLVAFVMMLLNGHPESALHVVALGCIWAACELWLTRREGFIRPALLGVGAGVAALLLLAIYMLPILEALPQTMEHDYRQNLYRYFDKSVPLPVAATHLATQLVPFRFGETHRDFHGPPPFAMPDSADCGSVIVALAAFGLWRSPRRAKWLALALIIGGLLIGDEVWPFATMLGKLPLFNIALNARLIFATSFGLSMLAAFGADRLFDGGEERRLAVAAFATFAVLLVACALTWPKMATWGLKPEFITTRSIVFLLPLVLLAIVPLFRRSPAFLCAVVLLLVIGERTAEFGDFYPTNPARFFYPKLDIVERLPKTPEPYRMTGVSWTFYPNMSTLYGVEDVRGYQAMTFLPLHETNDFWSVGQPVWYNRVDDLTRPFLTALNVRFAFAPAGMAVPDGWKKVDAQPGIDVFENLHPLPRAYVPPQVVISTNDSAELAEMAGEVDFHQRAWIRLPHDTPRLEANGPGTVATRRLGNNGFSMHASMVNDGWVVISEAAWKGWRAYIDGKPIRIHRANHALLGVRVPRGEHDLRIVYWPKSFVVGRAISAATLALLIALAVWRRRAARRDTRRQSAQPG